jgi:hypothetical protein
MPQESGDQSSTLQVGSKYVAKPDPFEGNKHPISVGALSKSAVHTREDSHLSCRDWTSGRSVDKKPSTQPQVVHEVNDQELSQKRQIEICEYVSLSTVKV